jgi:LemA protein
VTGFVIAGVIALVVVGLMLVVYSRFVRARNTTLQAWRDVDKQLRARYEVVPSLLELVQRFARDRGIVGTVNSCRIDAMAAPRTPEALAGREQALERGLRELLQRAEGHPDLLASQDFLAMRHELGTIASAIDDRARRYDQALRHYNALVHRFPALLVARMFGFTPEAPFPREQLSPVM